MPENKQYLLFGGAYVLANKLQFVGDKMVKGFSTKQWFLLRNISDMPEGSVPTITRVANEMDTTRQNIAKMLETMERDGFVTLEESETDRRSRCVRITEQGRAYLKMAAVNARKFLDALYDGVEDEELNQAGNVLLKMIGNLQKMQEGL